MKTLSNAVSGQPRSSTVGRGNSTNPIDPATIPETWSDGLVSVYFDDSLNRYTEWPTPTVIVSDGGYGILGFEGDTSDHLDLPHWYQPHIEMWSKHATPSTTLWFWNSEIGWAVVHPILEAYGWRYVNANIWNKGNGHIAGNVNTRKIRRFPVVTEVCAQYVYEARIDGLTLKQWLLREWRRTGLPLKKANEACDVADAAVRKYLDQGHLWYFPPPEMFEKLQKYANLHGDANGRPYFAVDGKRPTSADQWIKMRAKFKCPHGYTNVWDRPALHGSERYRLSGGTGRAIHLNQKPLDLITMIIQASSEKDDVVWEPFGGLFTACIAARSIQRRALGCEIDSTYFYHGVNRLQKESEMLQWV
ncbi:MAG: DNA methyltransferase [Gammaproteobacteria bacterium]|nr:DNA methyltransferase [Gammaproteobacteria bacterium]